MSQEPERREIPLKNLTTRVWTPYLTLEQMVRLAGIRDTFQDVLPKNTDDWIDSFRRDAMVDRELGVWERMGVAYARYLAERPQNEAGRKEVLSWLLALTMYTKAEAVHVQTWNVLSAKDHDLLYDYYRQACQG